MAILRIISIQAISSIQILVQFNYPLDSLIGTGNVAIEANDNSGITNSLPLKTSIKNQYLRITCQPLVPSAAYNVIFQSTDSVRFKSKNGVAFLLEDRINNSKLIFGPIDPENEVKKSLSQYLQDNIYNLGDPLINDILNSQATEIARASYDIQQLKNDNYLSLVVENEKKTRSAGPWDRLNEEGAYEIIRVSTSLDGKKISDFKSFDSFPSYPVSLQASSIDNELLISGGLTDSGGTFEGLILSVKYSQVIKVSRILIVYGNGNSFNYDPAQYGYQLKTDRYDPDLASVYQTLELNQIRLSGAVLEDSDFAIPRPGDLIYIDYEYKNLGKLIDPDSVEVSQVLEIIREVTPPILTKFSLRHYPVVDQNDVEVSSDGVSFLDPLADPPFSEAHPAFVKEIAFRIDGLPSFPGEFSIDYSTGTVFVYGETQNNGTGNFPPAASYFYRKYFSENLDYTYDSSSQELVRSPLRDLEGEEASITFDYERVLVSGVDYVPQIHTEVLNERVGNKISSTNSLQVSNGPVTDVFRIYNETSGEIYRIDGWRGNKVFFTGNNPPTVTTQLQERASYSQVTNETILVTEEVVNASSIRVFKAFLNNSYIQGSTEESIGSSFNSSCYFSNTDIFETEIYFDGQTETEDQNINRLASIGQYLINYSDGIIYVAISNDADYDLGSISYKKGTITTNFSQIYGVNQLYYSLNSSTIIPIEYSEFTNEEVTQSVFNRSDERFLNGDTSLPYIVDNQTISVTSDVFSIHGVFDHFNLTNSTSPLDFGENATFSANVISLSPINLESQEIILSPLNIELTDLGDGIELAGVSSVVRTSDNVELWDGYGSYSGYTITLSGLTGSPAPGDSVIVHYSFQMTGAGTPVVDYSKGDLLIDYSYVTDQILISYEFGDNCIQFNQALRSLDIGTDYYVSYKIGALRDGLLRNFGSLVNIPILNNFDPQLPRERYRDALMGALQSFTKGPTIPSIKNLVKNITHIEPELIEAIFEHWVLNYSYLSFNPIETTGDLILQSGKYNSGLNISESNQTVSLAASSNLRLEEGSLETWIIPDWNGLDNDATLTFSNLLRDGSTIPSSNIFIGAESTNPEYSINNTFDLTKDLSSGVPSAIYTALYGVFIYYDVDVNSWKLYVKDEVDSLNGHVYSGKVSSSGDVYNVKYIPGLNEMLDVLRSGTSSIDFILNIDGYDGIAPDGYTDYLAIDGYHPLDGYSPGYSFDGFSFLADDLHYIFDFGKENNKNRISLFKDGSGYLCFSIYDNQGALRQISKDVSDWLAGEKHHIGISWKLSSSDLRDEMHLFVDGFEVPNILKYGGRPISSSSDRFRTIKPEYVVGTVPKNVINGADMHLAAGSSIIYSDSVNFTTGGIVGGDLVEFPELGLGSYTISSVSGNQLTLSSIIPLSFDNAKFTVNAYSVVVSSQLAFYKNIVVSVLRDGVETELAGLRADLPDYSIDKNALNQDVLTILGDALVGDTILVRTLGLNHRRIRERQFVYGSSSSIIKTQLPAPINLSEVNIYSVLLPLVPIGPDNATFGSGVFTANNLTTYQPSNGTQGRTLSVRVTSSNTDFTTPVSVTINGSTTETLLFSSAGIKNTVNKFSSISDVDVIVTPYYSTANATSVEIKEAYSLMYSEGNNDYPILRYSTQVSSGYGTLSGVGDLLTDSSGSFVDSDLNQYIVISSPGPAVGTYSIVERIDEHTVRVSSPTPPDFSSGIYKLYHTSLGNAGFVNGFFTLETAGEIAVPYLLPEAFYEFDYSSYLSLPFDPFENEKICIGSSRNGDKQVKGILDELRILNKKMTDVRIGEPASIDGMSFTEDSIRISPFKKNKNTLVLLHFDSLPLENDADLWISGDRDFIQTSASVNSNFEKALLITEKPYVIDNAGILPLNHSGTIEFWISPRYDVPNDPTLRYYFDAYGATVEETVSLTRNTIKTSGRISEIVSIKVANSDKDISGDATIRSDSRTVQLKQSLPYQNTPVVISYIPTGVSGNRFSIYKDPYGFISLSVIVDDQEFKISQYVSWARQTWHRIMVTFDFNNRDNEDQIRMFIDGEEGGTIKFGQGFKFGQGLVFGQRGGDSPLTSDINFADSINQLFLGGDYLGKHTAYASFDNVKFSNIAKSPALVAGQSKDLNFNSNIDVVLPAIEDLYTTKIINFDTEIVKKKDFAILHDEAYGIFNFTLNVIDSFGYVSGNAQVKQILETLIDILKPAVSKAKINYYS